MMLPDRFTELAGDLIVLTDAIRLALRLEEQGHALTARDGQLLVGRGAALSPEDRALVHTYKRHLLAIAGAEVAAPLLDVTLTSSPPRLQADSGTAAARHPSPLDDPHTLRGVVTDQG